MQTDNENQIVDSSRVFQTRKTVGMAVMVIAVAVFVVCCAFIIRTQAGGVSATADDAAATAEPEATMKPSDYLAMEHDVMIMPTLYRDIYVRAGPGFTFPVKTVLHQCIGIKVLQRGIWYKVDIDGTIGYVYGATFNPKGAYETNRLQGVVVGIDPDGQIPIDSTLEAISPGSSIMAPKMEERSFGVNTNTVDYKVNLDVAKILGDALELEGATVRYSKTDAESNMSNQMRARAFAIDDNSDDASCDIIIRLSCNSDTSSSSRGVSAIIKEESSEDVVRICRDILKNIESDVTIPSNGISVTDRDVFLNWCSAPVLALEMGYLTNSADEKIIVDSYYQTTIADAIRRALVEVLYAVDE